MTATDEEMLAYLDKRNREFRQEMRNIRAAQLRRARWWNRLTRREQQAQLKAWREQMVPQGIQYWITPQRPVCENGGGI